MPPDEPIETGVPILSLPPGMHAPGTLVRLDPRLRTLGRLLSATAPGALPAFDPNNRNILHPEF
jgi:hypothetical protein